jgi:hypothetical protein
VATASVSFMAVGNRPGLVDAVTGRAETLRRFYDSIGPWTLSVAQPAPNVVVGMLAHGPVRLDGRAGQISWNGQEVFSWSAERAHATTTSAGPAALYEAGDDELRVTATHAVAAALLAGIEPRINTSAVAQFIAFDFVGDDDTLIERVRCLPPPTPAAERWRLVPESDAYEFTKTALETSLAEQIGSRRVAIALTAGLDSTAGAIAITDLGADAFAFTWGEPDWPDSTGAAETAARLGIEHRVLPAQLLDDEDCLAALDHAARWRDGVARLAVSPPKYPEDTDAVAGGMGGEVGRTFYYDAWVPLKRPNPSHARLAAHLTARSRLVGADAQVRHELELTTLRWVEAAAESGLSGWELLDVLYADQRVRRWGRSQLPPMDPDFVAMFTPVDVMRGLLSFPRRERLGTGFHGRLLSERGFAVRKQAELPPDYGRVELALRRLRWRMRRRPAAPQAEPVDPYIPWVWNQRPRSRAFVGEALENPLIADTMGGSWSDRTADGFRAGRAQTAECALRAAGIVAFERALAELRK